MSEQQDRMPLEYLSNDKGDEQMFPILYGMACISVGAAPCGRPNTGRHRGLPLQYHCRIWNMGNICKFIWNNEKNKKLMRERGISFEVVVYFIEKGQVLDDIEHPNKEKYGNQNIFIVNINDYV